MKFPTPYFDLLRQHFRPDPKSVHICTKGFLSGDPSHADTSGTRMSEALVLACNVVPSRTAIVELARGAAGSQSQQRQLGLGRYGYQADVCEHGMARGGADLAYFLEENWGRAISMTRPTEPPQDVAGMQGLIAYIGIDGEKSHGHVDVWFKDKSIGKDYWGKCRKALFWKLT